MNDPSDFLIWRARQFGSVITDFRRTVLDKRRLIQLEAPDSSLITGYTVTVFHPTFPPTVLPLGKVVDIVINLTFGFGSASAKAQIDYNTGQVFAIPGSSLTLEVENKLVQVGAADIAVGAFASPGFSGGFFPSPVRTLSATNIGGGATVDLEVPPFARQVKVNTDVPGDTFDFLFRTSIALGPAFNISGGDETTIGFFPVPSGSVILRVTNTGGAAINSLQAVFQINI